MAWLWLGPPRGLRPFLEARQKHRAPPPPHTHTTRGRRGSDSGRCSQGRLKTACCTACQACGLDSSRRLSAEGRGAFPPRRAAEWKERVVGTARPGRPAGTVSESWASTQIISVLDGRAGLLCETGFASRWLLGSPGSLPGHDVPIRALGPEEIREHCRVTAT